MINRHYGVAPLCLQGQLPSPAGAASAGELLLKWYRVGES
jgi:hypothetical protein